jgi:hypothetical protein
MKYLAMTAAALLLLGAPAGYAQSDNSGGTGTNAGSGTDARAVRARMAAPMPALARTPVVAVTMMPLRQVAAARKRASAATRPPPPPTAPSRKSAAARSMPGQRASRARASPSRATWRLAR